MTAAARSRAVPRGPDGAPLKPRKEIVRFGKRGQWVRCFIEVGHELVRVQYLSGNGQRERTESWPNTPSNRAKAKVYAEAVYERLTTPVAVEAAPRLTLRAAWDRYLTAVSSHLRGKTIQNYQSRWSKFELFAGRDAYMDTITPETLDDFRKSLRDARGDRTPRGHAVNQIAEHVKLIKQVFAWARERKLIRENLIASYRMKVAKDDTRVVTVEYSHADWQKILGALDHRNSRQWRPYVAILLAGILGPRENALLHLEWKDVDLVDRTVRWDPQWDKLGKERVQPLPRDAVRAFRIAAVWRRRQCHEGPYVFPPVQRRAKGGTWTAQALTEALHVACGRAGVTEDRYQAMHAFRRMAAGNALELTGNLKLAGEWIGDTDLRVLAKSYFKHRPEQLRSIANQMSASMGAPKAARRDRSVADQGARTEGEGSSDVTSETQSTEMQAPDVRGHAGRSSTLTRG